MPCVCFFVRVRQMLGFKYAEDIEVAALVDALAAATSAAHLNQLLAPHVPSEHAQAFATQARTAELYVVFLAAGGRREQAKILESCVCLRVTLSCSCTHGTSFPPHTL